MKKISFAKYVSMISLFCSFTNFVPISAAISAFSLAFYPFSFASNRMPRAIIPLFVLFVYAAISTVFYDASSLFNVEFYRRDGNFFVVMTPLLFLASSIFFVDLERTLRWFVYVSTAVNFSAVTVWILTGVALFRNLAGEESVTPIYHFLFVAHNAAGGFLAVLSAFSLALYLARRNTLTMAILAINLVSLGLTNSRGSMLGLAVAVILVLFAGRLGGKFYSIVVPALIINLLIVIYIYSYSDINYIIYRQTLLTKVVSSLTPNLASYLDGNISIRIETAWPLALHAFLQSPIFGIGFGAYNDVPWDLWGWRGVFSFNSVGVVVQSDAHAHHTYLHVMAEMGALGLILLLWFLNRLHQFLHTVEPGMVRMALLLGFWVNVVSSFTEHRLFTPSQMLPYVIMVGFAFAQSRYLESLEPSVGTGRQAAQPKPA
jgi:O-antigen ligase